MADGFGRMPFSPEMNPLQAEIGSDQRLVAGGDLQDGAIIPDAGGEPSPAMSLASDVGDEQSFGKRHDKLMIYNEGSVRGRAAVGYCRNLS